LGGQAVRALELIKAQESFIKNKFHMEKIGLFGSMARGEGKGSSGFDFLVEFEEGFKTCDNYIELKFFLEDMFDRKIDLVTLEALRPQMKAAVLEEVIYA
jgi:uncharacterized protein